MFSLEKIINEFELEIISKPTNLDIKNFNFNAEGTTNGHYESYDIFDKKMVVLLGDEDSKALQKDSEFKNNFVKKISRNCELVILSKSFDEKLIIEEIKKHELILMKSKYRKVELNSMINSYISYKISSRKRLHACLMNIYGEGILIFGKSGIGKSELLIELIKKNHMFIADDAVDVFMHNSELIGKSAKITKELLEIRGVGIINVRRTFGIQSILNSTKIKLVIELIDAEDVNEIDRLGNNIKLHKFFSIKIPKIEIPVSSGRQLSSLIETAVTEFKNRRYYGYSVVDEFEKKIKNNE